MTNVRLLLVDDEPLILATFKRGLRACGYDVTTVGSAEAALASAASAQFDLAILDIRMPGISGLELGRMLRERHELPSLYLTAIADEAFVVQAVREGALTYLVKPVDVGQLIPAIEAAFVRAREIRALAEQKMHLDRALAGRRHTSVVVGVLMERHQLSEQQAFEMMRADARRRRRTVEHYCEEMIARLEAGVAPAHGRLPGRQP